MSFLSIAPQLFYFDISCDLSDFLTRHTDLFAVSCLCLEQGSPSLSFLGESARPSVLLHRVSFKFSLNFGCSFVFTHQDCLFWLNLNALWSIFGIFYRAGSCLFWFALSISFFRFLNDWLRNYSTCNLITFWVRLILLGRYFFFSFILFEIVL